MTLLSMLAKSKTFFFTAYFLSDEKNYGLQEYEINFRKIN